MKHYKCNKKGCYLITESLRALRAHRAYHVRRSAHNQPGKCQYCEKMISHGNLSRHVKRNHPEKVSFTKLNAKKVQELQPVVLVEGYKRKLQDNMVRSQKNTNNLSEDSSDSSPYSVADSSPVVQEKKNINHYSEDSDSSPYSMDS